MYIFRPRVLTRFLIRRFFSSFFIVMLTVCGIIFAVTFVERLSANSDAVASDPALKALADQSQFAVSQHVNGAYWTPAEAFGAELEGHSTGDLQTMLDQLVEQAIAE